MLSWQPLRASHKAARSLTWAFQKPPYADALEQCEGWQKRLLDHQVTCEALEFLESLRGLLQGEISAYVAKLQETEQDLRALALATGRVVDEIAAIEGLPSPAHAIPELDNTARLAFLDSLRGMPAKHSAGTLEWLQATIQGPAPSPGGRDANRKAPTRSASARTPAAASARRGP